MNTSKVFEWVSLTKALFRFGLKAKASKLAGLLSLHDPGKAAVQSGSVRAPRL